MQPMYNMTLLRAIADTKSTFACFRVFNTRIPCNIKPIQINNISATYVRSGFS